MALTKVRESGYDLTIAKLPSGSPIQVVSHLITSGASTASSTATALVTLGAITTTQANSKILVQIDVPVQVSNDGNAKAVYSLRSSIDSYGSALQQHVAVHYTDSSNGWVQLPSPYNFLHTHAQSVGTEITYKLYGLKSAGNRNIYVLDAWSLSPNHSVVLTEIVG